MTKITKQDMLLWEVFTKNITPLKKENAVPFSAPQKNLSPLPKSLSRDFDLTPPPANKKSLPPLQFNRRELKRFNAESVLDLHGCTRLEAYDVLLNFLQRAYAMQKRYVKIITGKGDPHNLFTLRHEVKRWLYIAPFTSLVLAYHEAKPNDGGKGALYIHLRKAPIKLQDKL